jgi:transposase InsO family protein
LSRATLYRQRADGRCRGTGRPGAPRSGRGLLRCRAGRAHPRPILGSRLHGEGYRKIWARLRHAGIRTSARRVRRLMGRHGCSRRTASAADGRAHDGTITTAAVDVMWGTDMTETVHPQGGGPGLRRRRPLLRRVRRQPRRPFRQPLRGARAESAQGVLRRFGGIGPDVARGLVLRHDHGSNYMSRDFQGEIRFFGIEGSPSLVREPEGNGVAERFIRTLKENFLWVHTFDTIEDLRRALRDFVAHYNATWLVARHGYRTPNQIRAEQRSLAQCPSANLPLAA